MLSNWKRSIVFIALAAFVAGVMFMGGCLLTRDLSPSDKAKKLPGGGTANAGDLPGVGPDTIAQIVSEAGPAVVKISTTRVLRDSSYDPFFNDPFFRQFFRGPNGLQPRAREQEGLGTGFVISEDGYILTNEHVIDGASKIEVIMQGKEKGIPARVVGANYDLDLAVLKVNPDKSLPTLKLGDSDRIKVGNWVIAIGNPFGFDHTVTIGVISAKGRPVQIENRAYENLLQTDASINPGNSGGPLLNLNGEVVGINTAVAQAQGIGFAIPTSTVKNVLDDLKKQGGTVRPWLGVQLQAIDQEIASYFGLENTDGALVVGVVPGSPAEEAGLVQGDIILQLDGKKIKDPTSLTEIVKQTKVGQRVVAMVYRNGRMAGVPLTVTEKPAQIR